MDIAIIGFSGRFPEADNIQDFYSNLREGRDSVRQIPANRAKDCLLEEPFKYQLAGFLESIDKFDYQFFNISLGEAITMDPHQRLMMEVAYETIEGAGYNPKHLSGKKIGVYAGDMDLEYSKLCNEYATTILTGNMNAATVGRLSRFFNFRGEAVLIDTTCSSSLVALHVACNAMKVGNIEAALVCAANLTLFPDKLNTGFQSDIEIASTDGKAKPFSSGANGSVGGEAIVCLLLKPLSRALEDGDIIHGVIKGTAVNQDAALSGSLTAPSAKAQSEVIVEAWQKSEVDPRTITYIEAHGTGTKLGDPIEISGIDTAFRQFTAEKKFCAISALKSNIGHTDSAAGLAGIVKALLSLKYGVIFPSLHYEAPNPFIDFENSATYVNSGLTDWTPRDGEVRRAGVSSFGLSGTNCHVVLEEAPAKNSCRREEITDAKLWVISAKNEASLKDNIAALVDTLKPGKFAEQDVCYTLQVGKGHYQYRVGLVESEISALLKKLENPNGVNCFKAKKLDKTIFVFSSDIEVSRYELELFAQKFATFKKEVSLFEGLHQSFWEDSHLRVLVFQYAFYKTLEEADLVSQFLIGTGIGEVTIDLISGTLSRAQAMKEALSAKPSLDSGEIARRTKKLVEKFKDESVLYVEIGKRGDISNQLIDLNKQQAFNYVVTAMNNATHSSALEFFNSLYLCGVDVRWSFLWTNVAVSKVSLPSYRFQKTRVWVEREPEIQVSTVENWFYKVEWQRFEGSNHVRTLVDQQLLVFTGDDIEFAEGLVNELRRINNRCVLISNADGFFVLGKDRYSINYLSESDYNALLSELNQNEFFPTGIVHLGAFRAPAKLKSADLDNLIISQYNAIKYFRHFVAKQGFKLCFVTSDAHKVLDESTVNPVGTLSLSMLKGLKTENPVINTIGIDLSSSDTSIANVKSILRELTLQEDISFVSYRGGRRFISFFKPLTPAEITETHPVVIKEDGIYMISGGATGIGFEVAKSLALKAKCHLILLGRTLLPPRSQWNDLSLFDEDVRTRINNIQILRQSGSLVEYHAVDVGDTSQMTKLFNNLKTYINKIDGIVHAAGLGISNMPLHEHSVENLTSLLSAKVAGTIQLDEHTRIWRPEFFVCFSSLNAILPQRNSTPYTISNGFMDSYVQYRESETCHYLSINWPGWLETGMALKHQDTNLENAKSEILKALTNQEGIEVFYKALGLQCNNLSIGSLAGNVDMSKLFVNPFFSLLNLRDYREEKELNAQLPIDDHSNATSTEAKVTEIWKDVLKSEQISLSDDFFEIGGHSLNGMQVINRITDQFNISLEFEELFDFPTVSSLATHIDSLLSKNVPKSPSRKIVKAPVRDLYELSLAQRNLWMANKLGQNAIYNLYDCVKIEGEISLLHLKNAQDRLVKRHAILRTIFVEVDGKPKQKVIKFCDFKYDFPILDFSNSPNAEEEIRNDIASKIAEPFDLSTGPLFRIIAYKLSDSVHVLAHIDHHIISDGWSTPIRFNEIMRYYDELSCGLNTSDEPLAIQYQDYAEWDMEQLKNGVYEADFSYWKEVLSGKLPVLQIPTDKPRSPIRTFKGRTITRIIDSHIFDSYASDLKDNNNKLFIYLLSTLNVLLHKYSNQTDIIIAVPVSIRQSLELEEQLGYYVNIVPIRTHVHGDNSFDALASDTAKTLQKGVTHNRFYMDMIPGLTISFNLGRGSLFDVMAVMINDYSTSARDVKGLSLTDFTVVSGVSKFDLTFMFLNTSAGISVQLEHNADLFNVDTINEMLDNFEKLLFQVMDSPNLQLKDLNLVKRDDQSHLRSESTVDDSTQTISIPLHTHGLRSVSALEQELLKIIRHVFKIDQLDVKDNYFDVGANSMMIIWLLDALQERFPEINDLTDLFNAHSVSSLAELIVSRTQAMEAQQVSTSLNL